MEVCEVDGEKVRASDDADRSIPARMSSRRGWAAVWYSAQRRWPTRPTNGPLGTGRPRRDHRHPDPNGRVAPVAVGINTVEAGGAARCPAAAGFDAAVVLPAPVRIVVGAPGEVPSPFQGQRVIQAVVEAAHPLPVDGNDLVIGQNKRLLHRVPKVLLEPDLTQPREAPRARHGFPPEGGRRGGPGCAASRRAATHPVRSGPRQNASPC